MGIYTLTHGANASASADLSVGNVVIRAGGSASVDVIDSRIQAAIDAGRISCSPAPSPVNGMKALTDSTGGTAAVNDTLVAISGTYAQAEVANNFATLARELAASRTIINALMVRINSLETQLDAVDNAV